MKKLNIPLVVILAVGFVVTVIGVHFLHGYQVSRSAESLLARAKTAESQGDVDEQIRLLRRYLRHRPKDLENLKVLLETSREQLFKAEDLNWRDLGLLLGALEKAIRDNPEDVDLRRQGYVFSATVGRYSDALDHLEQLKSLGQISSEDRVVLARCLWQKGEAEKALQELSDLVGFNLETETFDDSKAAAPEEIDAYTLLAVIYIRDRTGDSNLSVAQAIVDKAIERNPESPIAYLRRAGFYQENAKGLEDKEKSMADIDSALELAPDDPVVILAASSTAMMLGDFDRAASLADQGLMKHPENPDMYAKRAEVARAQDQTEQALEFIKQGLEKRQMNGELLYRRGSYEVDLGMLDEARTTVERLGNRFDHVRLEMLQSRILMADNDFAVAARRLEQLRSMGPTGRTLALVNELLVRCYERLGRTDKIPSLFTDNESSQSKLYTSGILARQGRLAEAAKLIEDVLQTDKDLSPKVREQAIRQLFPILIQIERAKLPAERDWSKVDTLAEQLARNLKLQGASKAQFDIEVLVQKDLQSEARDAAERAIVQFPNFAQLRLLLAQLTPDPEQGLRMLEQLQQTAGDSALLRLNQADKIQAIGGPEMATRLKALESHNFTSTEEITTLYQGIAAAYRRAGMYEDSLRLWRELLKMHPKNLALRVVSFDVAYEASDFDAMNEMVAEIAKVEGQRSSEWQVAEARRQLWMYHNDRGDKGQLADIMRLLQQAQSARPDFAPLYMVKAEVQLANNEPDAAIDSMKTALQKRPGEVAYLQRLSDVLRSLNRDTEAQKYLAELPEQHKRAQDMVTEIRMLLAKDPAKAVETAEKLFPPTSDDQTTLMYLVEVYEAARAMDKGLPILQRAIQLKPSEPRPWLVYVRTLVNQGKTDEAKRAIEKMKSRIETENAALWLGQCYATVGELGLAEASYDEAVQREPKNTVLLRNQALLFLATGQSEKLFACLKQLMAIDNAGDEQTQVDVAWARRTLAQQLASTGRYQDFLEALKTLEPNGNDGSTLSGEDLLLWLRICANRAEAPSRKKALTRLNQIRDERELVSAENAILAYLYYVEGRWTDAKRVMLDLLAKNPNNLGFVTTYIEWLIERGDDSDATAWIRKLNPQSIEAIRYSSILLTKQGKAPDVAKRLMALVPKQLDEVTVVRIMEELGKYDERFYEQARRQWASMVKKKPETIHAYISYLTRMPDGKGLEQALSLSQAQLQQAITDQRADVAEFYLSLGIKALRAHRKLLKADSPHFERVRSWFDLARQANVDELTLAWSEVDYFDVRRDYGRLETLYGELLKRNDLESVQEAVVRNNLAFIYAISNKGDQALDVIGDAISQLGPRSDLLDTRGLAHLARGDFDRAVEDLRLAVADGRADSSMYFHLALAELRKGNREEAQSAFKTAEEMGLDAAELSLPERQLYQQLESQLKENELSQATR